MSSTGRFRRSDRLLDSRDYRRVSRRNQRAASRYFVVLRARPRAENDDSQRMRLGITVSRKVGNSVARNYIKRNVREWFRSARIGLDACDLVVIARRDAVRLRGRELGADLADLLARTGLAKSLSQ